MQYYPRASKKQAQGVQNSMMPGSPCCSGSLAHMILAVQHSRGFIFTRASLSLSDTKGSWSSAWGSGFIMQTARQLHDLLTCSCFWLYVWPGAYASMTWRGWHDFDDWSRIERMSDDHAELHAVRLKSLIEMQPAVPSTRQHWACPISHLAKLREQNCMHTTYEGLCRYLQGKVKRIVAHGMLMLRACCGNSWLTVWKTQRRPYTLEPENSESSAWASEP